MGRVYEALKRAAETSNAAKNKQVEREHSPARREADNRGSIVLPVMREGGSSGDPSSAHQPHYRDVVTATPEQFLPHKSTIFTAPETARISAPIERTEQSVGSALPDGQASRVAGATLGAAGSARTPEFVSINVSAARVEPHLVAITQPQSPHAERFRSLRTRVLHASERKKIQAIVITSASIMEGKTLTSLSLSWLLAQTDGVRALLIDGDLRQPCAADYLGIDAPVGLSEVLAGDATLAETIVRLEPSGLHLLPGGARRDDVAELLSGPKWSAVLRETRQMFDFIVIDAPPLGIFTDATVLIGRADAALIVARSGKTRYMALDRVLEPLPREKILGIVLNGSDEAMDEHNYYYQRRYARRDESAEDVRRGTGNGDDGNDEAAVEEARSRREEVTRA